MSKTFRAWKIDEPLFLPPTVGDFVAKDHLARFVLSLVKDELDLVEITGTYGSERGQPPYDPTMMTALLLYSYSCGIYSSRRIAKACRERVDFMSIVALDPPDFRTISDFRKRHLKALGKLFLQILRLCEKAGLVKLGHVALDGTKIKANASKHKAMSYERMEKREAELEAEAKAAAEAKLKAAAEAEAKREAEGRRRGGRKAAPPSIAPEPKAQKNFTDPESRIMKSKDGFVQAYNAQAAVDSEAQIIVAQDVTQSGVDSGQLFPMTDAIEANLGRKPEQLSADAGYCSEANLEGLENRKIDGYVATGRARDAVVDKDKEQDKGEVTAKSAEATAAPAPTPTRVEAMRAKIKAGGHTSPYRFRKILPEPVFGQIKQARGFRQFLCRGFEKVRGEWAIVCTVHNLLKLAQGRSLSAASPIAAGAG